MRLYELMKYDIPHRVLDAWVRRQGDYLLPLQEKAIQAGLLDGGGGRRATNLLISAPTSSGKTFCGEMAAMAALLRREKAVMLLPLKSIAEEKLAYYRRCYGALGIRIIIVSRDHPENDADFRHGNFDLALAIFEKCNRLLTVNPDILRQIGLVVVDELQMLDDTERGAELEMLITKLLVSDCAPRIIALSAVIGDDPEPASWLRAHQVGESVRPVDLLLGVAGDGRFHYRSFNSGREGNESFGDKNETDPGANLMHFLRADDDRKLVFLKSRQDTMRAAGKLAGAVSWPAAKRTLARLDEEEPSVLLCGLRQALSRGVAFHNADLTNRQRRAVESGFRDGEVRVIFSTPTLAMGVNLPARTVFLETMKYVGGDGSSRPQLVPISAAEFQNITGRAGRFGIEPGDEPGRAVILATSDFEHDVLWANYINTSRAERLQSVLDRADLRDVILDFSVTGLIHDREHIAGLLAHTFSGLQGRCPTSSQINIACEALVQCGLMTESGQSTPSGRAAAECGLPVTWVEQYRSFLDRRYPGTLIGWLALALMGGACDFFRAGLTREDYRIRLYERVLYEKFADYVGEIRPYVEFDLGRQRLDFRTTAVLKAVFVLSDWADEIPLEQLENRYRLHHGQIVSLAETSAWLLGALGRLIEADDCQSSFPALLDDYAFRVQHGIDSRLRDLYYFAGDILNRSDYKRLVDGGIMTSRDLLRAPREAVVPGVISPAKYERLHDKDNAKKQEDGMHNAVQYTDIAGSRPYAASAKPGANPSVVELDGSYERERYLVRIDGFPVRLTGKSFKYLTKLACFRLLNADGWIYKDDIETGFNQARYLYRLKQEMNRDGGIPWGIFENNRLGYYRLDLEPSRIRINLENLKNHPDFELRALAERLAPRLVG